MSPKEPEHPAIIYRPDLVPKHQRAVSSGITLFAWLIWIYLFLPLISLAGWWLGIELFASYMLLPEERTYFVTLTFYLIVIALFALIILVWSRYNQLHFGSRTRRSRASGVSDEMVQARFQLDAETLDQIHASKVMVLDLDDDGLIREVQTKARRQDH